MTKANAVIEFWNELTMNKIFDTPEEWFKSLANRLMNDLCLMVGKNTYRVTECEFYYKDAVHSDPYIHQAPLQQTTGKIYLNKAGGLDITFGNLDLHAWGGILIRGIRNLETNNCVNQITKIVEEIFSALGNIILEKNCVHLAEMPAGAVTVEQPIQSTRVRLTRKEHDNDNFYDKPYRFIVELNPAHQFHDKERVVKQLLLENKIRADDVAKILGYNLKQG